MPDVLNANCLYCHRDFVREITAHRVIHDEELYCVRCHDSVGHGPEPLKASSGYEQKDRSR